MFQCQTEEFPDLAGEYDDPDPCGEANRHREGYELDERAKPRETGRGQHQAGQEGCEDQPLHSMFGDRCRDQNDESPRRAADLEPRPAEQGDEEAPDDSRIKTLSRGGARGDGYCHGERQCHDCDGQTRDGVRTQMRGPVALAQDRDQFGGVKL